MIGRKFILLLALLAAFMGSRALAVQLGDTRAEVEARYDTAPVGDHAKGIAIYHWDLWKMQILYVGDVVRTLTFTKVDPLSEEEILKILDQNGGRVHWKGAAPVNGVVTSWTRSDGATAVLEPAKGQMLTLTGGKMPVATPTPAATPAAASPTAAPVVSKPAASAQPSPATSAAPQKDSFAIPSKAPGVSATSSPLPKLLGFFNQRNAIKGLIILFGLIGLVAIYVHQMPGSQKNPAQYPFAGGTPNADGTMAKNERYMVPVLETTNWQHFELLIAEVYRRKGYAVEISSGDGADGGIDLHLRKEGELMLAQCKRWAPNAKVSVQAIREFYGVMVSEKADRGVFINTSTYTQEALNFANGKPLELIDGAGVRDLVASVTQPGENIYDIQRWLPNFTATATITHPDCPFCKTPMVLRTGKKNGARFWGCANYPGCQGKRDARVDLIGKLAY